MRLLLDEMYSPALSERLHLDGIDASRAIELGLSGKSDTEIFAEAVSGGQVILTENVADFARIAADQLTSGLHHPGILIALTSRFSRRPAGIPRLVAAIHAIAGQPLDDRVIYLERPESD
jgi:hypothetical protein